MSMGNTHPLVMASGKQIKGGHTFVFGENDTRAVHDACPKALQTKTTISLGEMKRLCGHMHWICLLADRHDRTTGWNNR